jgi:outer membrane protein insertion porin family
MRMKMNNICKARAAAWGRHGLLPLIIAAGLCGTPLLAQDSETIVQIVVQGASKQTPETVLYKSGLKTGDDLRQVDLTAVLDRLWASGAFDDIKFEVEDAEGGKKLIIRVVERPLIKEIVYRGGTEVGLSSIKDKVKDMKLDAGPDTVYDPEAARKIKDLIVDKCAEKGFRNPVVSVDLEPIAPGVSRLVFDIKEGGKAKIYKIVFKGNTILSSAKLQKVMKKTRTHWMLSWITSHDLLVDKNLDEDLQNIKKAYWRVGYKDVFVGQPTIEVEDFTTPSKQKKNEKRIEEGKSPRYDLRATLTIPILEGEQYFEGTFKVMGNDKVFKGKQGEDEYRLRIAEARRDHKSWWGHFFGIKPSLADLPPGKLRPFDLDAVNEGLEKMKDEYGNKAYVMFHADKKLEVREEDGVKKVDVTVKVDEGEPYTVRRISFEGNTSTKDKVIRRAMLLQEGGPFRLDLFRESFNSIGQLGYFDVKGQEPKVDFVPEKPEVDVTLKGQEAGTNELMFTGGYGSVFGFSLGASFSTRNLGGGGETLSVSYNAGQYQKSAVVSYTEPYLFDLPYSLTASVHDSVTDYDASRVGADNAYKQKSRGFGISVGSRLSNFFPEPIWAFYTTYRLGYSFSRDHFEGGVNYLYRDIGTLTTSMITQSLTYDTTDDPFKPTRGFKLSAGFDIAAGQIGTTRPFNRTSLDYSQFMNLGDRHIFGFNAAYGYIKNLSEAGIPIFNYYKPGGESSIRGYEYGQVGSVYYDSGSGRSIVVGGNKQLIFNFEYQFKVAEEFRIVPFYDLGNAWGPGEPIFSENTVHYIDPTTGVDVAYKNPRLLRSTGIELRIFLPISPAPLRFIWSRKLDPYPFDQKGTSDFQFSIGTTF